MALYNFFDKLFDLIFIIFFLRILLSWFPNVDWWKQPFKFIKDFTDPVFEPFRRMIPPLSGIDFSPIVVFFLLSFLEKSILQIIGHL